MFIVRTLRTALALSSALTAIGLAFASPAMAQVPSVANAGGASINSSGNTSGGTTLNVGLNNARTIIDWNTFSVSQNSEVNFNTGLTGDVAVLNRVSGATFSDIQGKITSDSNIAVWLINPNGIVIGNTGSVSTGSFLASTLDITNDNDFLNASATRFTGANSASSAIAVNGGQITTTGTQGTVLVAPVLTASGTFTSPGDTAFVTAVDTTLSFSGGLLNVTLHKGTAVGGSSQVVSGTVQGRNVYFAMAAQNTVTDALLQVNANVTATGTDRGVVIVAGNLSPSASVAVNNVTDTSGATSALVAGSVSSASSYRVQAGSVTVGKANTALSQNAAGDLSLRANTGNITGLGSLTLASETDGVGSLTLLLSGANIAFDPTTSIRGGTAGNRTGVLVNTSASTHSIQLGDVFADQLNLLIASGSGNGRTGNITTRNLDLNSISLTSAGSMAFGNLTSAASIFLNSGGTLITGDVSSGGVFGATSAGAMTLGQPSGTGWNIQAAGNITLQGASITAVQGIRSTGGQVQATSNAGKIDVKALSAVTTVSLDATGGNIGFTDLSAGSTANVIARTPNAQVTGNSLSATTEASLSGSTLAISGAVITPALTLTNDVAASLTGANSIGTLRASTVRSLTLNNTGALTISGAINGGASDVSIRTVGNLTLASGGLVTGGLVSLSTNGAFVNNRGSDAVTASDHWAIYLAEPTGNTYGGLNSNNRAVWNATIGTASPSSLSGNRYVFAYKPNLTVTSLGATKTYGTDLSGNTSSLYSVSGWQPGVSGVYLADTSDVFSGAPTVSSGGLAANADVSGNPYLVSVGTGTLSSSGYGFTFTNSGQITINPLAITATVAANNKTYDRSATGSGTVTLNGVLPGDTVGTSGTTFAFDSPGAGTGKTVTVAGTTLTGADAGNYTLTVPATTLADILKLAITASVTANNKTYDRTTVGSGTLTLNGVLTGDAVGTSGTTFTFDNPNAGSGRTVTVAGTTLTGAEAGNYTLTVPATALADILKVAITASVTPNNKTYDGTTTGSGTLTLNGVLTGDTVGSSGTTFTFENPNAGAGKTVTLAGTTLTGAQAGNYTLTVPATALADILKLAITASVTANNKTYDRTTVGSGTVTLNGVLTGDTVGTSGTTFTFDNPNAGAGKTVTVAGTTLTGAQAGNYTLTVPATALADILKLAITASVTANNKTYDRTTAGSGTVTLNGVLIGDTIGTSGTTFTFTDKNAGTGKTVSVAGTTLTGAQAGNYTLTVPATALADILKSALTATVTASNKTYNGNTAGSGTVTLNGVLTGDAVGTSGTTFTFADKNAGTGKAVTVANTTLTGSDAGNYTVSVPASALADILKASITVSADNKSKAEGTNDPVLTASITSGALVSGDTLTGNLTRAQGESVGSYAIEQGTLSAGTNYQLTFQNGTLTITAVESPTYSSVPLPGQTIITPTQLPTLNTREGLGVTIEPSALCASKEGCEAP